MNNFFQQLNRELVLAGVWGRAAEMLKQELRDHYLTEKAALLKYGKEENEATRLALSTLGDPSRLAQKARMELDLRDGSLRRQFLLRFLPLGLGVATYLAFFATAFVLHHVFVGRYSVTTIFLNGWVCEVYLVPWLIMFIWILRASYRPIYGWRSLLVLSSYLALSYCACALLINIALPIAIGSEFDQSLLLLHRMILITAQSLLLVITPWRVRARKLKQAAQGEMTKA